jgi:hypothetical protein
MKGFITEIDVAVARTGRTQELWAPRLSGPQAFAGKP